MQSQKTPQWDFGRNVAQTVKLQIKLLLNYVDKTVKNKEEKRNRYLLPLKYLFCYAENSGLQDILKIEADEEEEFASLLRMQIAELNITLATMLALMYSGITMSRHVFAFLPIRGGMALARRLHILGSYWGYVLMSLHLGLHWGMILNMVVKKPASQRKYQKAGFITGLLIAVYGAYVFIKRDFLTYMLLRSEFVFLDYEEPKLLFFLDYLALMELCIFIVYCSAKLVRKAGTG